MKLKGVFSSGIFLGVLCCFQWLSALADSGSGQSKCDLLFIARFVSEKKTGIKFDDHYRYLQVRTLVNLGEGLPPLNGRLMEIAVNERQLLQGSTIGSRKQIQRNSLWIVDVPDITSRRNQYLLVNEQLGFVPYSPESLKKCIEHKFTNKEQQDSCYRKVKDLELLRSE